MMQNEKPPVPSDADATVIDVINDSGKATRIPTQMSIGHSLPGQGIGDIAVGAAIVPAREVGRYQIVEKLGEGAMATVYKAFDPSINRQLVIKFLHANLCATEDHRQRFLREAKAAGVLSHPNIVTIFDVGEIDNRPYIAMELLDGGPLNEMMPAGVELPMTEVLGLGIQIANALDYAHSKGVYHRDIKPGNIMRLADGKTIKLVDFGIAHVPAGEDADSTAVGTVMGTPHYMSPEQARGEKTDARSDLWAAGVILYQLLTGKRPFNADSIATLLLRITQEPPKPMSDLRADVPASLRRIIARSLHKLPDKRFQSGRELSEALTRVLHEIDPLRGTGRAKRRGMQLKVKLALAMAAIVAITMTVTSLFVTHQQYQAMLSQTIDQGASIARLISVESAHEALSQDWVSIDVSVKAMASALNARGLSVIDAAGRVRVSTDAASVGKPHRETNGDPLTSRDPAVSVLRLQDNDALTFSFITPIEFRGRLIGKVQLLLPGDALTAVLHKSWWLMTLLLIVTALTATLATYLMLDRYARPLRLLRDSLIEIRDGHYDCRIDDKRTDEIGDLYGSFNRMAASLDQRTSDAATIPPGAMPKL